MAGVSYDTAGRAFGVGRRWNAAAMGIGWVPSVIVGSEVGLTVVSAFEGCCEASRAAALSGVPVSTVYDWGEEGPGGAQRFGVGTEAVVVRGPDGASDRFVAAHPKDRDEGWYPASPMPEVRAALERLGAAGLDVWSEWAGRDASPLWVERNGRIVTAEVDGPVSTTGQGRLEVLDLLGPFEAGLGRGPDLVRPRPHLRIVPGKVGGEPHRKGARLTTLTVAALASQGYSAERIAALYPDEDPGALREAVDLEAALSSIDRAAT